MRICVLSDRYPPHGAGGASKIASKLAERYRSRGHTVKVVTTARQKSNAGKRRENGVEVEAVYTPTNRRFRAYYGVYNPFVVSDAERLFELFDPDVVHAHNVHEFLSYHTLALADRYADRVAVTFHDAMSIAYGKLTQFTRLQRVRETGDVSLEDYEVSAWTQFKRNRSRYFPLRNRLNRRYLRRYVDERITVSDELQRALTANGIPCDRTIHNGLDVSRFDGDQQSGEELREAYGLTDDPIILFGGRVSRAKGGEHLARAFRQVAEELTPAPQLFVTSSRTDFVERMREMAGPHGDRIVAAGWVEDEEMRAAHKEASVVATPSIYLDPFPTMNIEAMASGTPVVTTTFGGGKEAVIDGETGYIVNPFDTPELADALSTLLNDEFTRQTFGRNGRRRISENLTLDSQVTEYLSVFDRNRG